MLQLLLGIALFFGIHSVSMLALPLRNRLVAKNELGWKLFYSLISLLGLVLMVRGYAEFKLSSPLIYQSPVWLHSVAAVLLLPVFILSLAPYLPGRISITFGHPQLVAVIHWAFAHLLVNGSVADLLLFGSFLVWALADRVSMAKRPARSIPQLPKSPINDVLLILLGLAAYAVFVFWLHEWLFGVAVFG